MKEFAQKGCWVKIYKVLLKEGERAPQVPVETSKVPLEFRVNGFLQVEKAQLGEEVEILTVTGRKMKGVLVEIEPCYTHSFGAYIPELGTIGSELRNLLEKAEKEPQVRER